MRIFGLNVASSTGNPNGRGWVQARTLEFVYLPIEEGDVKVREPLPTYRSLGFSDVRYPDLSVHLDPEFETFTYGHVRRFDDLALFALQPGDLLYFYATLDVLPLRTTWGVYMIGYFTIDHVRDTRGLSVREVRRLREFANNAHLKRADPAVHLLVKGSNDSRLYRRAIPLSHPDDSWRVHPRFEGLLTTSSGRPIIGGNGWWRWLHRSGDKALAGLLRSNE